MSETLEYVNHLSREIGPRPAGTEEERQAAEYIAGTLEVRSGLPVEIEDFQAPSGNELPHVICMGLAVIAGVFSLFSSIFAIPAVILLVIATALLIAELKGQPVIMKLLSKGASQNVVAKYEPGFRQDTGRGRKNKIVIVARYDSGKVRNELSGPIVKALPILQRVSFWSVPAMLVLVLIRSIFLGGDTGAAGAFFAILVVITIILSLIPLVLALLHKISPYNEGANCNAAGVAALMEVANRVGRGRMSEGEISSLENIDVEQDDEYAPVIHGAQEAQDLGVMPEGANLYYDVEPNVATVYPEASDSFAVQEAPESASASERLLSAKAAIAAMTGAAVSEAVYAAPAAEAVVEEVPVEVVEVSAAAAPEPMQQHGDVAASTYQPVQNYEAAQQSSASAVPDWFTAAQERAKANKPSVSTENVKRSRYADALDAAVSASANIFNAANQQALTGMDAQLERLNDGIVEVPAPGFEGSDETAGVVAQATETAPSAQTQSSDVDEAVDARAVVGRADNEILAGVVEDLEVPEQEAISMPSFLSDEALAARPEQESAAPSAGNRVVVSAYTDEPVADGIDTAFDEPYDAETSAEEASVFALPVDQPEPVSDFVGAVTDGYDVSAPQGDNLGLSSKIPVVSPSATGTLSAIGDGAKQRAPLADSNSTAKSLLSMLPSINPQEPSAGAAGNEGSNVDLRAVLPSLSGTIPTVSGATSSGSAGATGVFAPVTDELVAAATDEEDLFVEDADDSDYQENFTDSGAYAGPDYVEMPKAPLRNFFDKIFHRNKKRDEDYSTQLSNDQYYDDEVYDDQYYDDGNYEGEYVDEYSEEYEDQYDEAYDNNYEGEYKDEYVEKSGERWNGGALSALKEAASSVGGKASQAAQGVAGKVRTPHEKGEPAEQKREPRRGRFSSMVDEDFGYESSPRARFEEESQRKAEEAELVGMGADMPEGQELPEEFEQVETFRNPYVNADVWFVALGSELAGNAGMKAFLDEHGSDLRGAIIIELDALGAGKLSLVETEGSLKKAQTSSRMKRYLRKVAQTTGINCPSVHMDWNDSATSYANTHGQKAMHLVGFENGKPALLGQEDDVEESIDAEKLEESVDVVMELLRVI